MSYIENCNTHRQAIIDRFESPYVLENFFNKKEIEKLITFQFQNADRVKAQISSGNIQSVIDVPGMMKTQKWMNDKFKEVFSDYSRCHTGNFYITNQHHDAHVDLISEKEGLEHWAHNQIPFKSVVFPLYLSPLNAECHTAFMKQRRIGYAATFDKSSRSEQKDSDYKLYREYDGFIDINGNPLPTTNNSEDWTESKYPSITKESFSGFTEEMVIKQRVGDVMVFDACQVHASCQPEGTHKHWLKNGMNIQFYKTAV